MNGFRFTGQRKAKLTQILAEKLNIAGSKGYPPKMVCKFLQIPAHFNGNTMSLSCTTKQVSGYISRVCLFLES